MVIKWKRKVILRRLVLHKMHSNKTTFYHNVLLLSFYGFMNIRLECKFYTRIFMWTRYFPKSEKFSQTDVTEKCLLAQSRKTVVADVQLSPTHYNCSATFPYRPWTPPATVNDHTVLRIEIMMRWREHLRRQIAEHKNGKLFSFAP